LLDILPEMTNALATAALIVGIVGFVTGGLALRTLGRLRRSVALLSRGTSGRETILDVAERHMAASDAVRNDSASRSSLANSPPVRWPSAILIAPVSVAMSTSASGFSSATA